jgi:hypothetical protein
MPTNKEIRQFVTRGVGFVLETLFHVTPIENQKVLFVPFCVPVGKCWLALRGDVCSESHAKVITGLQS